MKLTLLLVLIRLTILLADDEGRGDCIPEQSPCKNAASNCCSPEYWACRWREDLGYRCYERNPFLNKGASCIPKGDLCVPRANDKCCDDMKCKALSTGVQCTDGSPSGPWRRSKTKNCKKTKSTHES